MIDNNDEFTVKDAFIVRIRKEDSDLVMMVPPGMVETFGFEDGDTLVLTKINDGTIILKKIVVQE